MMITDQTVWKFEEERLGKVYKIIQKELEKRREEIKSCRSEMIASRKEMWENVSSSPQQFEEMIEAQQHIDELKREWGKYKFAQSLVERMEKIALSPYFARVDFVEEGCQTEQIYIGALSLIDDKTREIYIYDWRAPISSIFYDYETGPASYKCLEGEISGNIVLKRQFRIFRDKIEYMFDSSLKIDDEILQRLLSKNADDKMRNIVASIQREQNKVIRNEENRVLIVQGAAGSGKTSIALHRAAYLLYRFRNDNINSKNIIIFSPNQIFNDYISDVLPELGEENIRQTTFLDFAISVLGKDYKYEDFSEQTELLLQKANKEDTSVDRKLLVSFKATEGFRMLLKNYVRYLEERFSDFEDIKYKGRTVVAKEELLALFNNEYRNLPLARRLDKIRDRIYYLLGPFEKEELKNTQEELEEDGGHKGEIETAGRIITARKFKELKEFVDSSTTLNVYELYTALFSDKDLLERLGANIHHPGILDEVRKETLLSLTSRYIRQEDLAPLLYLHGEIEGIGTNSDIKHVIIDEAQDYSLLQMEVFKQHYGYSSITMLGDINQSIYLHSGGDYKTAADVFGEHDLLTVRLTKSYRSTKEIIDFAKAILMDSVEIEPVNRGGEKPRVIFASDERDLVDKIAGDARAAIENGAKSAAIICKTARQSKNMYSSLKSSLELNLISKDDEEFKKGIVVLPSYLAKGLEFDAVFVIDAGDDRYSGTEEQKLLYVACTRALHVLNIYFTGQLSEFFGHIDKSLYITN